MNPARLTVVPEPTRDMEVVTSTVLLVGEGSIHLKRSTHDLGYTLLVKSGAGMIHLDPTAARALWAALDSQLMLDEAEARNAEFAEADASGEAFHDMHLDSLKAEGLPLPDPS